MRRVPNWVAMGLYRCLLLTAAMVGFASAVVAHAQAAEPASSSEPTVSVWLSEVSAPSDGYADTGWQVLGRFRSYSEASACSLGWSHLNPTSLRLTREREIQVAKSKMKQSLDNTKEAQEAIDNAKEINKKGLTADERKRGDTIKEYKAQLQAAGSRAMNAKRELTSMTGQLTNKQIDDANKLIGSFNQQYDSAVSNGWSFSGSGIDRIELVANATQEKKSDAAVPTIDGTWTWSEMPDQNYKFNADGKLAYIYGDPNRGKYYNLNAGEWRIEGSSVSFEDRTFTFHGRFIDAGVIKGTLRSKGEPLWWCRKTQEITLIKR